jgi:hypothetical protein
VSVVHGMMGRSDVEIVCALLGSLLCHGMKEEMLFFVRFQLVVLQAVPCLYCSVVLLYFNCNAAKVYYQE